MKPTTIFKIGLSLCAAFIVVTSIGLGTYTLWKTRSPSPERHREYAAAAINQQVWQQQSPHITPEETKRILLLCHSIRTEDFPTTTEQFKFLNRWQTDIDINGPKLATATARACQADPQSTDPSPPIHRPLVATPTP